MDQFAHDTTAKYSFIEPEKSIQISRLYTIHYLTNQGDYYFSGEKHQFWELFYVDKGECIADTDRYSSPIHMSHGDLLIYRPSEFHRTYANNASCSNLFIISFESNSPAMDFFLTHTHFHTNDRIRSQLAILLNEAENAFPSFLSDPDSSLIRQGKVIFGAEQIITMMLEYLLIELKRSVETPDYFSQPASKKTSVAYIDEAETFIKTNLHNEISVMDVCQHVNVSRSQLQKMFVKKKGTSIKQYIIYLRIEEAKFLIRNGNKTFSEIAQDIGYTSVHHFSNQFHKSTGMTPTEYLNSIHAISSVSGKSIHGV